MVAPVYTTRAQAQSEQTPPSRRERQTVSIASYLMWVVVVAIVVAAAVAFTFVLVDGLGSQIAALADVRDALPGGR